MIYSAVATGSHSSTEQCCVRSSTNMARKSPTLKDLSLFEMLEEGKNNDSLLVGAEMHH